MNDFAFKYLIEQLQKQEDETVSLNRKIDDLRNSMKSLESSVNVMKSKLAKLAGKNKRRAKSE